MREERPADEVLDAFSAEAALKVEHYETVAYKGLIDLAKKLGMSRQADLLKETLREEEATATELETLSKKLGQALPMEAKESEAE